MLYFIINTKNYSEIGGEGVTKLAKSIASLLQDFATSQENGEKALRVALAVPAFALARLSSEFPPLEFYTQHLDDQGLGSTTGFLIPEIAKSFGARGSLINHSEHRVERGTIAKLVERLKGLRMISIVCVRDEKEVSSIAELAPDFIAIEPPELIGSGNAVSKARPTLISDSKKALQAVIDRNGANTRLLCGAGIVEPVDATRAIELGADGILVASGIVKSKNWDRAVSDLANGLIDARKR